ncbi:MAG: arylamine N-acetyltransferase, partial [Pyrinomonadaceae bacterium]
MPKQSDQGQTLSKDQLDRYLTRIGYAGSTEVSPQTLRDLQLAHLYSVPFENLDISAGRYIRLDLDRLFEKIVNERRGGFCYELNGLFSAMLRSLGFSVDRLAAGVANKSGGFGPKFDHLTLLVHLPEPYLADVGFGDSF